MLQTTWIEWVSELSNRDLIYRALAAAAGGPVDLMSVMTKPFMRHVLKTPASEKPVGGAEWIGKQMEDAGLVSTARDPLKEFGASLLAPGSGVGTAATKGSIALAGAGMGIIKGKGGTWKEGSVEGLVSTLLTPSNSVNEWLQGPFTKYVKTRMGTEGDEVRKLAEEDVGFIPRDVISSYTTSTAVRNRSKLGAQALGVSPTGRAWEDSVDASMSKRDSAEYPGQDEYSVTDPTGLIGSSNLRHLTDELNNATRPSSGLPEHLQLSKDAMKNLSMEKAVRRVNEIDKWRAAKKVDLSEKVSNNSATFEFKKYETVPYSDKPNTVGLKWVEIKANPKDTVEILKGDSDDLDIDTYDQLLEDGYDEGSFEFFDELKDRTMDARQKRGWIRVDGNYATNKPLSEALEYEGDTMGHCVGGYCGQVMSGTKIYSLRDAKGEPHVTVEVTPDGNIEQIKGKGNAAPKDSYVPFVQDFVASGKFGKVSDIKNAQMHEIPHGGGYATKSDLEAVMARLGTPKGLPISEFLYDLKYNSENNSRAVDALNALRQGK